MVAHSIFKVSESVVLMRPFLAASFLKSQVRWCGYAGSEESQARKGNGRSPMLLAEWVNATEKRAHDDIWSQHNVRWGRKLAGGILLIINVMVSWNNDGSELVTSRAWDNRNHPDRIEAHSFFLLSACSYTWMKDVSGMEEKIIIFKESSIVWSGS